MQNLNATKNILNYINGELVNAFTSTSSNNGITVTATDSIGNVSSTATVNVTKTG